MLTTHYLEEAQRMCKRSAILNHGKLLALDETGNMIRQMSERVVYVTLKEGKEVLNVKADPQKGIPFVSNEKGKIKAFVVGGISIKEILDTIQVPLEYVQDLETEEGDLEHAFLKLLKNGGTYKDGGVYGSA